MPYVERLQKCGMEDSCSNQISFVTILQYVMLDQAVTTVKVSAEDHVRRMRLRLPAPAADTADVVWKFSTVISCSVKLSTGAVVLN